MVICTMKRSVKLCLRGLGGYYSRYQGRNGDHFPKMGKIGQKKSQKNGFLNLVENWSLIFLNLFYNESLYYLLCSCAYSIYLGKICFLRYGPKCSQPVRLQEFLNQLYLQNKVMKQPNFSYVGTNSWELKHVYEYVSFKMLT